MWTVRCGLEIPSDEQTIACTLTLSDNTVLLSGVLLLQVNCPKRFDITLSSFAQVLMHWIHTRRGLRFLSRVVEEDTDVISTMLKFDFMQPDDAIQVVGDATITYAGGWKQIFAWAGH